MDVIFLSASFWLIFPVLFLHTCVLGIGITKRRPASLGIILLSGSLLLSYMKTRKKGEKKTRLY